MAKKESYQVIEDNGGGMSIFFFDKKEKVILGFNDIEWVEPGNLDQVTLKDAQTWDNALEDPQAVYDNITSYEFGWKIVADQDGVYPEAMGRAAQRVFGIEAE